MKSTRLARSKGIEEPIVDQNRTPSQPPTHKNDLRNIIELTEQNEANPVPQQSKQQSQPPKQNSPTASKSFGFWKYINCIKNIWRFITKSTPKWQLDINDDDFTETIAKIKNKKQHYPQILPPQIETKKVLVLDLDQTLIHTSFIKPDSYDFQSSVVFNGRNTRIFTVKRFGLDSFLFQMSKLYEIIVYTAGQRLYSDHMINLIDPKKRISHRLYRQNCIIINKSYYLKNINILGRNIHNIVLVDDNSIAGMLQPDNFYKIQPFSGNQKDRYLCRLADFLKHIHEKKEILPIRQQRRLFQDLEIHLSEEDTCSIKIDVKEIQMRKRIINFKKSNQLSIQFSHNSENTEQEEPPKIEEEASTEGETTASQLIKSL